MTNNPPAPPKFLSDEAQEILRAYAGPMQFPPHNDAAAWEKFISQSNEWILPWVQSIPTATPSRDHVVDGVTVYIATPEGADEDGPVLLNFHGGGLVFCAGEITRLLGRTIADIHGLESWTPDYRMPPSHPFPAALDDAVATYRALLDVRAPEQIVVSGESAGGNIAAAMLLRAKDEGLPMPAAVELLTPEVDLTESGDSFVTLRDISPDLHSLMPVNELYAAGRDLSDPYLSPLFGDLSGFPPAILVTGTRDLYLSNTVRMHRRLRDAGVDAQLHVIDGRPHGGFGAAHEEDAVRMERARFVRNQLVAP